jgi:hypothetical protein
VLLVSTSMNASRIHAALMQFVITWRAVSRVSVKLVSLAIHLNYHAKVCLLRFLLHS